MKTEEYEGRLVADGNGNLLADEGERQGDPVTYDEDADNFRFLAKGEPSHNDQHHQNFVGMVPTQSEDSTQPGYAGTEDDPVEGMEHHFLKAADIAPPKQLPDKVAARISGHTHQHKEG